MNIYLKDNFCTIYKLVFCRMQQFFIMNSQNIVDNIEDADIVITGVCAAFDADEQRSINMIQDVLKHNKPLYIFGCLASVNPQKIPSGNMYHTWETKELVENIIKEPEVKWEDIILPDEFRTKGDYRIYNSKKRFVGITTGCSFECSYCPHKLGAGTPFSRGEEEIITQINNLINNQVDTIILTGIDTAFYGKDRNSSFPKLLKKILSLEKNKINFHIAQFNPEGLSYDYNLLVECCQDERIKDFQLPIQTTSQKILELMNRNYSSNTIEDFIKKVRIKNDKIMFRTDLLVGFPTETKEELDNSIEFAVKNFSEVAVYGFELKDRTPLSSYRVDFFEKEEIDKRVNYARQRIKEYGLIVHSGGQLISTLLDADKVKAFENY